MLTSAAPCREKGLTQGWISAPVTLPGAAQSVLHSSGCEQEAALRTAVVLQPCLQQTLIPVNPKAPFGIQGTNWTSMASPKNLPFLTNSTTLHQSIRATVSKCWAASGNENVEFVHIPRLPWVLKLLFNQRPHLRTGPRPIQAGSVLPKCSPKPFLPPLSQAELQTCSSQICSAALFARITHQNRALKPSLSHSVPQKHCDKSLE